MEKCCDFKNNSHQDNSELDTASWNRKNSICGNLIETVEYLSIIIQRKHSTPRQKFWNYRLYFVSISPDSANVIKKPSSNSFPRKPQSNISLNSLDNIIEEISVE